MNERMKKRKTKKKNKTLPPQSGYSYELIGKCVYTKKSFPINDIYCTIYNVPTRR